MQKVQRWSHPFCTSTKARVRPSMASIMWPAVSRTLMMSLTCTLSLSGTPKAEQPPLPARQPADGGEVGELKARAGMPPADPEREVEQVARLRALAHESGLDPQFAEAFLGFIVAEVIHHHERIAGGG